MEPTSSVSTTTEPTVTESPSTVLSLSSPGLEFAADCAVGTPESCSVFRPENTSYMGNGNVSPELTWSNVPSGTASFAIKFTDLTFGQAHWAIWNIPAGSTSLPAGIAGDTSNPAVPAGAIQTNATFAEGFGYLGPQAPCNVYEFVLYALAVERFEPSKPDFVTLVGDELEAAEAPVLGRATLAARNYVAGECD